MICGRRQSVAQNAGWRGQSEDLISATWSGFDPGDSTGVVAGTLSFKGGRVYLSFTQTYAVPGVYDAVVNASDVDGATCGPTAVAVAVHGQPTLLTLTGADDTRTPTGRVAIQRNCEYRVEWRNA